MYTLQLSVMGIVIGHWDAEIRSFQPRQDMATTFETDTGPKIDQAKWIINDLWKIADPKRIEVVPYTAPSRTIYVLSLARGAVSRGAYRYWNGDSADSLAGAKVFETGEEADLAVKGANEARKASGLDNEFEVEEIGRAEYQAYCGRLHRA